MQFSIYLHKDIVQTLKCFGDLNTVVNKILEEGANNKIDVMNRPACRSRDGATKYLVDITEPTYLELYAEFGPYNQSISIRRLLYWFVENDIADELGWKIVNNFVDMNKERARKKLAAAQHELTSTLRYIYDEATKTKIMAIGAEISRLLGEI